VYVYSTVVHAFVVSCVQVLAVLLGVPERADWKACKEDKEAEEAGVARFKEAFAPLEPQF